MRVFDCSGQWTGRSVGDPPGELLMDLDPSPLGSTGFVYLFSSDPRESPSAFAQVNLFSSRKKFVVSATPKPFDGHLGYVLNENEVRQHFPNVTFPTSVEIQVERVSPDFLNVSWKSSAGTFGSGSLERSRMPTLSRLEGSSEVRSWNDFKAVVSTAEFRNYIFRGQSKAYPLQTTFHRTKRKVLYRYLNEDIQQLHRSITGRTRHIFNLDRPPELGALLNLAQHHGFPTPLLDWTYSPFVAAWFSYQNAPGGRKRGEKVRIYSLNRSELLRFNQIQNLTFTIPHTSILEPLAIENDRATPQQGVLMFSNMQDIERHIGGLEEASGSRMLSAYDLPVEDAKDAINDLAMMGITRSTLMPGLESICLDLKDRLFSKP